MQELVSVMIPVYNAQDHIRKCLDSLLVQTYENIQIVVVNDGSKDSSGQICEEYAKRDSRVKLINQPNGGEGAARNTGLREADGEYLCFVDADDYVKPDFVEKLYNLQKQNNSGLSICGFTELKGDTVINETHGDIERMNQAEAMEKLLREDSFKGYVWNKMFRMNIIRENKLKFDITLAVWTDVLFVFDYMQHIDSVTFDPTPEYYYIYVENSASHEKNHVLGVAKSYSAVRAKEQMIDRIPAEYTGVRRQICIRFVQSALAVLRNIGYLQNGEKSEYYIGSIAVIKKYYSEIYTYLSKKEKILVKLCLHCPGILMMMYRLKK